MMNPNLTWLKTAALFEGTSLIALVFVAVPFKYWLEMPQLVKVIGPVHGALFVAFIATLLVHLVKGRINARLAGIGAIASFIPFGTFVYKVKLLG